MDTNNLIVNLQDISFSYPDSPLVLDKLSLKFFRYDRIGLMGPNGSGKTTLFHIIMGLLKHTSGSMEIFGKPVTKEKEFDEVRRKIGLLFQDADDQLFSPTVIEDVAFGPLNLGMSRDDAVDIAKRTLESLDLAGFEDRVTYKLSGGEKRLVSLATILAMKPEVLLLDEPTAGLDDKTKAKLISILSNLDLSFILISHEIDFLFEITDSIYTMENKRIVSDKEAHLHQHIHAHPHGLYTHKHSNKSSA
ncbi:MAG: ABC transporter ATP-binding protein [Desulfobacterales bacterium]|uniref:ABC transporter ATP-binding protein n=1 Tax=Candidatus Desulfaltia bathyphila TaxID=2841697 RepID=A0A8J6TB87_9BACT|nr:ABC transporter ATP-binding protein [Candidatus Desulfaltia bathyphila]MBL7195768.1 ABC transporter ATP-binding protein [Desulfobacterales bacterium]MBL7207874.1 ABC transporter ATP-binding protein [Desulfobacterales bacterium]